MTNLVKWIENLEEIELLEIGITGVNLADTMLAEKRCKMCVRDKISSHRKPPSDFTINIQESLQFGQNSHPGQLQEAFDVTQSLIG